MQECPDGSVIVYPEDINGLDVKFFINGTGVFRFTAADDGEGTLDAIQDLYRRVLDYFGPKGSLPGTLLSGRLVQQ